MITVELSTLSRQWRIREERDTQDTLCAANTPNGHTASPRSSGNFLVLKTNSIKLPEHSFPIDLKDLTYIFVIFVVQMEAVEVN